MKYTGVYKIIVWIFIVLFLGFTCIQAQAENFSDIDNHKYKSSIQFLSDRKIVSGYGNGKFGPDNTITRSELLKIVLSANSVNVWEWSGCFTDVGNTRATPYICYAKVNRILNGYEDGSFKPNQTITISESLKIALNTFGQSVGDPGSGPWYDPYFNFVHNNNIFSKYTLRPDVPMTRGMMAFLVHQLVLEKENKIVFNNHRDINSAGCGLNPPVVAPTESMVNGITRHYITDVWKNYNKSLPTKLIIAFHGRTNPNTMVRSYYKIAQASKGNAIIVYPSGLPEEWPSRSRSNPWDKSYNLRDFALFDTIVEEFSQKYCINKDQIFVAGHSLGAWFTNSLACARGDVIRAIGSVGGWTTINACSGPTAAIIMHNPEDALASFESGLTARNQLLKQNSCWPETIEIAGPAEWHCVQYTNCQSNAPVIWCPHTDNYEWSRYYTHTRPDFAGQMIRDFFAQQK